MYFAAFAQIMEPYLSIDNRKMTRKAEVVQLILDHSFPNKKAGLLSESTLERYFNGKKDNGTEKIVGDHICHLVSQLAVDYEASLFSDFLLAQSFRKEKISKLCKAFSNEIPDIDAKNFAAKIAELLGQIYRTAADFSASPLTAECTTQPCHKILEVDRHLISRIIIELIQRLDDMIEWSNSADANHLHFTQSNTIIYRYERDPGIVDKVFGTDRPTNFQMCLPPELGELYAGFTRIQRKLDYYRKRNPDYELLQNLVQKGNAIAATHFIPSKHSEEDTAKQKEIAQYREILEQCYSEISST